jgi:GPI ethanolamine phosphate transferase 1
MEHHIYTFQHKSIMQPAEPLPKPKRPSDAATDIADQLLASDEGHEKHHFRSLQLGDARTALFFFYFLQSGFFSTGNIASVSSFSLDAVYRLIPVFSPFSQGALLMLKLLIPFAVISANLGILNRRLDVAPSALFMAVMAISDILTMNFFWLVRDEGSWLDIGTSISHFVIASLLCAFVSVLEFVSEVFVSGVVVGNSGGYSPDHGKEVDLSHSNGNAASHAPVANGTAKKVP